MFGASSPFGQSSSSPFGSPSVFGQNNSPNNNPFAAQPFGSTSPFGAQTGSSLFGGTSTGVFGASSTPAFGSSMPAFGASSSPAFGASSSSFGGSSVFGQKPAFGGFGSTTPSSPFGRSFQQLSQPAFGSNLFGSSPFGATSQPAFGASSTPAFGASSTPAFGATSTPAFGATSTPAFGATSTPAFGATSAPAFGSTSTPTFGSTGSAFGASVFGSSTPAFGASSTPAFGASSTPAFGSSSTPAFGASSTPAFGSSPTTAFGATSSPFSFGSSPGFGQSTAAFGSTQFGASSTAFGAQSSPFGAQTTTPTFGSPGFGQQSFAGQQRGGTRVTPYAQTPEADSGTGTQPAGKLESISAMPAYKEKSHEELRWEDYQLGDKGGPNPAGQSSGGMGFNMNNTQQPSPFASSSPAFGQSSANPFSSTTAANPFASKTSTFSTGFGSSTSTLASSPFSATPSNPFGSTPAPSAFGSTPAFGSTSAFGSATSGSLFGTQSASPFGTSTSLFSTQAQGATSSFSTGLNFGNTQSSPLFQSTTPALGQTSSPFGQTPSVFGQAAPSFGQSAPAFGQSNAFGGNMFSSTPSLLNTSSMGFNQTTPTQSTGGLSFSPQTASGGTSSFFGQDTSRQSIHDERPILSQQSVARPSGALPAKRPPLLRPFPSTQPTQNTGGFGFVESSDCTSSVFGQDNSPQTFRSQGPTHSQESISSPFGTLPAKPVDHKPSPRKSCLLNSQKRTAKKYPHKKVSFSDENLTTSTTPASQQRAGTRVTLYAPTIHETNGGKFVSISAMCAYKEKSHEELRWEDYQLGDKGNIHYGFYMNNIQPPNLFVPTPTFVFGTQAQGTSSSFGNTQPFPLFQSTGPTFGQTSSPFGQTVVVIHQHFHTNFKDSA